MKKILLGILAVIFTLTLSACFGGEYVYYPAPVEETEEVIETPTEEITVQELFIEYGGTWAYS